MLTDAMTGAEQGAVEAMAKLGNDTRELARLAAEGYTDADLADWYGVPAAAIRAQFNPILRKARAQLRGRIRRGLLAAGDKGDSMILAYLAKTYLEPPDPLGESLGEPAATPHESIGPGPKRLSACG